MLAVTLSTLLAACTVAVKAAPALVRRAPIIENCNHDFAYSWDDGPYTYHDEINTIFTNLGEHTTFFVNGNNWDCIYDEANVEAIRHSYEQGHQIGHHTWAHTDLTTIDNAGIDEQMNRLNDAFIRILGVVPAVARPPYGGINQNIADYLSDQYGLTTVLWSDDSEDSDGIHTSEQWSTDFYHAQADNFSGAAMPLSHETYSWSVDALADGTAAYIKSKGIKLVTIAQCIDVQPYQSVTGVYGTRDSSWTCDGDYVPMSLPCSQNYVTPSATTCSAVASRFGLSLGAIKAANKFVDCTDIWQGTTLCIPGQPSTQTTTTTTTTSTTTHTTTTTTHTTTSTSTTHTTTSTSTSTSTTSAPSCVSTYTSVQGDDCDSIGARYGLTGSQIQAANSFLNCQDVWAWTPICIPPGGITTTTTTTATATSTSTAAPSCWTTYTAGTNDTCSSVAQKFGTTSTAIQGANTFLDCNSIWQWTPICIPVPTTCTTTYYSQSGDNCDSIGARYGVTGAQIQTWNSFLTCNDIWVNTPVCV